MPKKTPLSADEHRAHDETRHELEMLLRDARALLCNTYGVSSKIGKLVEKAHEAARGLRVHIEDLAYYSPKSPLHPNDCQTAPWNQASELDRAHRFQFEEVKHGRPLPKRLAVDVHRQLGTQLRERRDWTVRAYVAYGNAYPLGSPAVRALLKAQKSVDALRNELDEQVRHERLGLSTDELNRLYYGAAWHRAQQAEARRGAG